MNRRLIILALGALCAACMRVQPEAPAAYSPMDSVNAHTVDTFPTDNDLTWFMIIAGCS